LPYVAPSVVVVRPQPPIGAELLPVLGWCLSIGTIVGLGLGGVLLTTGPIPGYFQVGLAFMIMWALLGVAAGLVLAGLTFVVKR